MSRSASTTPDVAELGALVRDALPPTPTPDASGITNLGITDVVVVPLTGREADATPLWAVASTGHRAILDDQLHFVAIFQPTDGHWVELTRTELGSSGPGGAPAEAVPDFLDGNIAQVELAPDRVWLEVSGGTGAHGGTYHVLSFDGNDLLVEVDAFSPSPGSGRIEDVNGDGLDDVVLDTSDPYVFCYACGMRRVSYRVLSWSGERLAEVTPTALGSGAPEDVAAASDRGVALAEAGLFREAVAAIDEAVAAAGLGDAPAPTSDADWGTTLNWNRALIWLTANGRADAASGASYPILGRVFEGDYDGAADLMKSTMPAEALSVEGPLVAGTTAEGWEAELVAAVEESASAALDQEPELASAWFLRGWARLLMDPEAEDGLADLVQAAALAPADPFYEAILRAAREGSGQP